MNDWNDARSVTFTSRAIVPPPSSSAVRRAVGMSMSPMATLIPWRTNACAVARPIPRPPPVIAATWPVRERGCFAIWWSSCR